MNNNFYNQPNSFNKDLITFNNLKTNYASYELKNTNVEISNFMKSFMKCKDDEFKDSKDGFERLAIIIDTQNTIRENYGHLKD
jgi:hypothetical protein